MKFRTDALRQFFVTPILLAMLAVGLLSLNACDLLGGSKGEAHVRVRMVDNPFPFDLVSEANVHISRVELIGEGEHHTVMEEERTYNLLELRDGVSALLGEVDLPVGTYSQARFIVDSADVKLNDDRTFDLNIPSGAQTGIKVLLDDLELEDGQDVTLTLDFDVEQSFVVQGSISTSAGINGFIFTPVIVPESIVVAEAEAVVEGDSE